MTSSSQSSHYGADYDYLRGSPHLRHRHLYEHLTGRISEALEPVRESNPVPDVLEIGAGDGSVTERLLAMGCSVTGTEISSASVEGMQRRFGRNDRFRALYDEQSDLAVLGDSRFDLVLFASVLHHIPDYLAAIRNAADGYLRKGGSLVSIQDPLWYPRVKPGDRRLTELSFLSWRLAQGDLLKGIKTRLGRATRGLSEDTPGDTIEYHVVRNGVDEQAVEACLSERFESVEVERYWSSQGPAQQRIGERLGRLNTFAIFATGHLEKPVGG